MRERKLEVFVIFRRIVFRVEVFILGEGVWVSEIEVYGCACFGEIWGF